MDIKEKLLSITEKDENGCWICRGSIGNDHGHKRMNFEGRRHYVHRLSYELFIGEIPEGHLIRHKCDKPECINPDHLLSGTQTENMADAADRDRFPNKRKTSCPVGHPYDQENTMKVLHKKSGRYSRQCRKCHRERSKVNARTYRERKRISTNIAA